MRRLITFTLLATCLLSAADLRTGYYRGRQVVFENLGGDAIYQGDIILGRTADVEAGTEPAISKQNRSTGITSPQSLWTGGVVPYVIDAGAKFSAARKGWIDAAVKHWNDHTPIKLVQRTSEPDYLNFTDSSSVSFACSSAVGRRGGMQSVRLPPGCTQGNMIHEIGHAIGLWHEQTRLDRNRFATVMYENIDKPSAFNFDQVLSNAQDIGPYDFNSLMHYGAFDFSMNGLAPALESVPAGIPMGQRTGLSFADIAAVRRLYGVPAAGTTIVTSPGGLQVEVDGSRVDDGTALQWEPGSKHTVKAFTQGDAQTRHVFGRWSDEGAAEHTITASNGGDVLLVSYIRQFHIETTVTPEGSGTIILDPLPQDGFYAERTAVQYRAIPSTGYTFLSWSMTRSPGQNPRWGRIVGPATVTATFTNGAVTTIATNPPAQTVLIDSSLSIAPVNVRADGRQHLIDVDTPAPMFINYRFTNWSDDGAQQHVITPKGGDTYTANFVTQYSVTTQAVGVGGSDAGTISIDSPASDDFYDQGTVLRLTPTPAGSNTFLGWFGDVRGWDNPATLTVDGQKLVTAYFGPGKVQSFEVRHAATGELDGEVAPGEIVSVYGVGTDIGPSTPSGLQVANGRVTTSAGGYQVLFDGIPAPVTYASARQINCVVPYSLAPGVTTRVSIRTPGQRIGPYGYDVVGAKPGLFTVNGSGRNAGAILNDNGSLNTPDNPAARGSVIVLYATGDGVVSPAVLDGQVSDRIFPKPVLPVSVRVGGRPAIIDYAGAAPSFIAGAMQINVRLPVGIETGPAVPVSVVVGDYASTPGVTVAIR